MKTKNMILVALFAILTAVGSKISIPFPIVPLTLQFLFVATSAVLLGGRLAAASQAIYVFIGLCGLPVFVKGGGIQYVFEPSFGYLLGFIACGFVIGELCRWLEKKNKLNKITLFFSCFAGLILLYIIGVAYLFFIKNFYLGAAMSLTSAIYYGGIIFLLGDTFWCVIVSLIALKIKAVIKLNSI